MLDVSVVSGTYNRLPLLKEFVASARASAGGLSLEIILVDGGSTDGTQDWCKLYTDIVLIEQGELLGAIKAYNAGCAVARGKYLIIGNDDIIYDGDTITRAYEYLEANLEVGQVAFAHKYERRDDKAKAGITQTAYGYTYGQCCMTRTWLGAMAGWWGTDGMRTYGGDTRLSCRLWEMGWPTVPVDGCAVVDREHSDGLREINSDTPWKRAKEQGAPHPDLVAFGRAWDKRLPPRERWIPSPARRVLHKAMAGNLRTMRFKAMMKPSDPLRRALIDALAAYGPAIQINQLAEQIKYRDKWQERATALVQEFQPDLLILQAQDTGINLGARSITAKTIMDMRRMMPWMLIVNWDGDSHNPITEYLFSIAKAVHLQLVISQSLFGQYAAHGIGAGYWPIGIEREYLEQTRGLVDGPDVLFMGTLYGEGIFPEAEFRRDAVLALSKSDLRFDLYGSQWDRVGLEAKSTGEQHTANAETIARAKMTLSISQDSKLWGYTSDRLYNITATGCPALVQRFAGMEAHGYEDGKTCIAFSTIPEMLDKAHWYADHDAEREAIGDAGRKMTHERHTWAARLEGLWAMLEDLP